MTQSEAVTWLNNSAGKFWDYDGIYGNQCFDLFNFFYKYVTGRNPYSDGYGVPSAYQIYDIPTSLFQKLPNTASLIPQPGDILVYDSRWGRGDGHVEMVTATYAGGVDVVGNNMAGDPSKAATKAYRSWATLNSGLRGVLRYNYGTGGGTDMIPDQDNYYWRFGQDLAMRIRGRQLSREEFRTHLVGQTSLRAVEILSDDPEAAKVQQWQDVGRTAVTDKWDQQIYTLQAQLADAKKNVEAVLADNTASKAQLRDALAKVTELENHPIVKTETQVVYTHDQATADKVDSIYNYFVGQFKTFLKYIKK